MLNFEEDESGAAIVPDTPEASNAIGPAVGPMAAAISTPSWACCANTPAAAHTCAHDDRPRHDRRHAARQPDQAERTLAEHGQQLEVRAMRRAFQNTMRADMIAAG